VICQRCGACCYGTTVVIRVDDGAYLKPTAVLCPHLRFELRFNGSDLTVATCAVHDEPWYCDTSCCACGDPEKDPSRAFARARPCALGSLVMATPSLRAALRDGPRADPRRLEYLGPWARVPRAGR
jgi:hypothetical protein